MTTPAKHTPGLWHIGTGLWLYHGGRNIADLDPSEGRYRDPQERQATAILISLAPEMREALEEVCGHLVFARSGFTPMGQKRVKESLNKANSILSRLEGGK